MTSQVRGDVKADTRTGPKPGPRADTVYSTQTSTMGLTNARTRIVGDRTGPVADAVVALVQLGRTVRGTISTAYLRISGVVTPLGWVTLAVVPVTFVAGYALGWRELVAIAFVGLILLVVAVIYLVGRSAYGIELVVARPRVVVGDPASAAIVVRNAGRRRNFGTVVEIPVGIRIADAAVPSIARGDEFRHEFDVPTEHRGVVPIGPVRTVRADPVGMVRRELVWTGVSELFVHPRTIAIPSTSTGLIRDLEGKATRDLTNSDVSFHALREYVPGDERRYIHWKSTAKTGTYMVRQFEETRRSRLVVALSLSVGDYAGGAEFEMAVSAAGSLGIRAIRDARDISVVVGATTPEFAKRKVLGIRQLDSISRSRLLDDLSAVDRAESSLPLLDVARVSAEKVGGISVAFLVCGSPVSPADLRAASVQFPTGVEVVAVVCDPDAVPGLRRVAGLTVLTIGYLEDLQLSLARAAAV